MINRIYKARGERIWRWRFRLTPADCKIQDVSLGTSDKQVAEKKRMELLREKEHERAGLIPAKVVRDAARRDLSNHLQDYLGDLRAKGRNGRYVNGIEHCFNELSCQCKWTIPQDVTADSFVKWRGTQTKAPKTLNEYLTSAKGFLNWLVAQGRIAFNPLASIQKVETRGREVRVRRAYSDTEFANLLSVAGAHGVVYLTAALTGIRHGELKELRWGDFSLTGEKPSVTVRASVSKNHKLACLPLHPVLVESLVKYRSTNAVAGDLAFKGLVPRPKLFRKHLEAAKIRKVDSQGRLADFHSLRHTFCTNLHRAGVSQREAMELMRHNDPRLTATTYTDTSLLALGSAVQKLVCVPSQIASSFSGSEGHAVTSPVAKHAGSKSDKSPVNKGEKSLSDAAWRVLAKIEEWCALQGLNLRPLPCEGNALPLS